MQFNDPDPVRWIAVYGLAAVACLLSLLRRLHWAFPALLFLVALAWAATLAPHVVGRVLGGISPIDPGFLRIVYGGAEEGQERVDEDGELALPADETLDLVRDSATPVSDDPGAAKAFTGRVRWVQIDIDEAAEDLDHLISPEERLQVAMARQ